jgi:CO/xanthine dehydrogenase FAD-binding subunit
VTGDAVELGPLARYGQVLGDTAVGHACPLLVEAIPHIGHLQVLARGTVCGSVAHADPAAEVPCVTVALEGTIIASSITGQRHIAASEFFVDYYTTALHDNELVTGVYFPALPPRSGTAFVEHSHRHGDYALVAVAGMVSLDDTGRYCAARVALGAVASTPIRSAVAEQALVGETPSSALSRAAAEAAAQHIAPDSDVRATADYRRLLTRVLVEQAIDRATQRARGTLQSHPHNGQP